MPPHSPSRSPSASTSTAKRPSKRQKQSDTPSLLNFFSQPRNGQSPVKQQRNPSPSKLNKSKEDLDLEWAIAESLKDQERSRIDKGEGCSTAALTPIKLEPRQDQDEVPLDPPSDLLQNRQESIPLLRDVPAESTDSPVKLETSTDRPPPPLLPPCRPSDGAPPPPSGRNAFSLLMSNSNVMQPTNPDALDCGTSNQPSYLSTMPYASTSADLDPLLTPSTLLKLWSHSDAIEAKNRTLRGTRKPRGIPFYKVLTGMPLAVDAFRFGTIPGCVAYFLSHAHSDHYAGLSPSWRGGPIYCTHTTANLLASSLHVPEAFLNPLPLDEEVEVPDSGGVKVTLLAANHCPGSCVFLFRGPRSAYILPSAPPSMAVPAPAPLPFIDPKTGKEKEWLYLHCGDFRASPFLLEHPRIKNSHLDIIYLDTTYLNPRYCFPAQEEVVRECGELCYASLQDDDARRVADEQRRTWEQEGIREEDTGWRNIKGIKEERAEEIRRKYNGERKGMQGWLGKIDDDDGTQSLSPSKPKNLGTLAKGLFRYDDANDDDELAGTDNAIDQDEEAAWVDAHELDDEKQELWDGAGDDLDVEDEEAVLADDVSNEEAVANDSATPVKQEGDASVNQVKIEQGEPDDTTSPCLDDLAQSDKKNVVSALMPNQARDRQTPPTPTDTLSTLGNPAFTHPTAGRLLVVVGTYSIGKEKIALSCALRLGTRIFCCDTRKYRIFSQLEDEPLLHSLITRDPSKAQVHVTNLFALNYESLTSHLKTLREQYQCDFSRVVAFRPTGWSYRPKPGDNTTDPNLSQLISRNYNSSPASLSYKTFSTTRDSTPTIRIYNVPYSEHSSFLELTCFIVGLGCQAGWSRVIPTVNVGNSRSRKKMDAWIKKWKEEAVRRKKRGVKGCEGMARAREYF